MIENYNHNIGNMNSKSNHNFRDKGNGVSINNLDRISHKIGDYLPKASRVANEDFRD